MIKNRFAKGNILTKFPIRKIVQSQLGKSTFGGKKIWFDQAIGKLNFDGRGELLGRFEAKIEPLCNSIIFFTIFNPSPECSPNFSGLLL